jgi:multicomponent Na+:H+ antiporter subunit D
MRVLLSLPVLLPIVAAALSTLMRGSRVAQRVISSVAISASLAVAVVLLLEVDDQGPVVSTVGGWVAPFGIALVADMFSALILVVSLVTVLAVLVFSFGSKRNDEMWQFHPAFLVLTAGVSLAFLTGDLFNLFVAFEVSLVASYVLLTLGSRAEQIRNGITYVVINMVVSVFFLTAIAFVYAAFGTVNFADLSLKMGSITEPLRLALALLFLVIFGAKAAMFPVFSWLPDSYPVVRAPIVAVFAGLLTKMGVYSLIRVQSTVFVGGGIGTVVLVLAGFTMVMGVLGAIAQNDVKRILSFHIISQIGYMLIGLGLFTVAGLAASVMFMIHQIPVKTSLFLVTGVIEESAGTTALDRVGGLRKQLPLLALMFGLAAASIAGLPPFSGFIGKLSIVEAGFSAQSYVIIAVSLFVSILTLFSMAKIWNGTFWGEFETARPNNLLLRSGHRTMMGSTMMLVAVTIAIAVFAGPIYELCERAAADLIDPTRYIEAVMGK